MDEMGSEKDIANFSRKLQELMQDRSLPMVDKISVLTNSLQLFFCFLDYDLEKIKIFLKEFIVEGIDDLHEDVQKKKKMEKK